MINYNNEIISFKYGENWVEKGKSEDPFSIVILNNNLSGKTSLDISRIPINYKEGQLHTTKEYYKFTKKYLKTTFDSKILNSTETKISNEKACDITATRNFKEIKLEERFIGFVKNQYIYQLKIITDKNIFLLSNDIDEILNSFIILDKSYNPPNRFSEKEIQEIIEKTRIFDKQASIKLLKRSILVIMILLLIIILILIIGIIIP